MNAYQLFDLLLMKQRNYATAVAIFAEASKLNPANPMNVVMRAATPVRNEIKRLREKANASKTNP